MAILQKENRPRGLRVPSLSAFKSKKPIDHEPAPAPAPVSTAPSAAAPTPPVPVAPPQYPVRTDSAPIRPARPQNDKELPPNPLPAFPSTSAPLGREDIHPAFRNEPSAAPNHNYGPPARARDEQPVHIPNQQTPSSENSVPPDAGDPLEDFIPDPEPEHEHEPELDGASGRLDSVSSDENNGPFTPPEIEPITVPLNRLHYACFQEHRSMMPVNNVWYSLPCMACQKFDREMRYRCVFCCLRICADCYQSLQKVPNRSLARFMETMPANS